MRKKVRLYLENIEMLWRLGTVTEEQERRATPAQASVAA
jgi:hypothetical protein